MTQNEQRFDTLQIAGLVLLTGALLFLGVISFSNQLSWQEPTDGVTWELRGGNVVAAAVAPGGAGHSAGIGEGDRLHAIDGQPPIDTDVVEFLLFRHDVGERMTYTVDRGGALVELGVVVGGEAAQNSTYFYLAFVGLAFLVVGFVAVLRHPDAPSQRFFLLALAFFVLFALSPTTPAPLGITTRASDPWNRTILWLDQLARNLTPALFLYFSLTFPRAKEEIRDSLRSFMAIAFVPATALFLARASLMSTGRLFGALRVDALAAYSLLDRVELIYFALAIALGVLALAHTYQSTERPLERLRLKWLVGGLAVGFLPFLLIYVPLQVSGIESTALINLSVLPLMLVPLSFGYAAVGFRLWDVEVILKRAFIYATSLLLVLGVFLVVRWGLSQLLGDSDQIVQTVSLVATLLVAVGFAPLREKLSDLADRIYYRDSYRARRTLRDFGRELNSENDLARVMDLLVQRVRETLHVGRVAVLLRVQERARLRILPDDGDLTTGRQLSSNFSQFVAGALTKREFLYVDDLAGLLDEFPEDREILEAEDLAYFLPLDVKGDVIGVLALGRKLTGDYLSSDDLNVLQPLAAHLALAVDNALLYREVQKRARELERLKSYSENIIESMTAGVMVLDGDGHVLSWNRTLAKLHGIEPDEAIGRSVEGLFGSSFCRVLDDVRRNLGDGLEPLVSVYRIPLRTRNDKDRVVTLSLAPLLEGRDDTGSTVIIIDDVTDRTQLESQLRQAEKLTSVGLLAAGVAHEVNTPLAGISSYVQMLQRKFPATDPRSAILEKIEKQTFRASSIVNNLLNFSRQETGEFRLLDANEVVTETLALAEIQLRKRQVRIVTELSEDLPNITGDPIKLQQVLMNLVLNARDAMPKGGDLHITTQVSDEQVIIVVHDTGSGIAPDNLQKVYDPFFTTKRVGKGTGLGLSVSYGIVQEHRGTLTVESDLDTGTTFRIALPVAAGGEAQVAAG